MKVKAAFIAIACSLLSTVAAGQNCKVETPCPCPPPKPKPCKRECRPLHSCCAKSDKWCGVTWDIYGNWVFLQPNASNLYYAAQAIGLDPAIAVPAVSPNWKIHEIDPDYHSGFEVGMSVLFPNTDINIKADWERLHAHDKASFSAPSSAGNMVGPLFDIGPNSAFYQKAKGHLTSHFDEVDLIFGKKMCFFKRLYMNFGAGFGFARIKETVKSNYSQTTLPISRSVKTFSKFIGAGPEIMVEYDYRMFDHFFLTGKTQVSLFMGQMTNKTTFNSSTPELAALGIPQPNTQTTQVPTRAQLVPGLQQKFGLSWIAAWRCFEMTLEAGYQCQIYLNAIQSVDMTAPQVLPAGAPFTPQVGVFAVGFERTLSDYILTGPYVSLKFTF